MAREAQAFLRPDPQKAVARQGVLEQAHGAIIARAAGIAWLCQQGEALNNIQPGEAIALDMRNKRLIRH